MSSIKTCIEDTSASTTIGNLRVGPQSSLVLLLRALEMGIQPLPLEKEAGRNLPNGVRIGIPSGGDKVMPTYRPEDLFRLDARTVVVTGGLGSVGIGLARTLSYYGADVVLIDLLPSPSEETIEMLNTVASTHKREISYVSCDVTNEESVSDAFKRITSTAVSPIRGLVACAGLSGRCPAVDYPVDNFRKIMEINVTGIFLCARAIARIMHHQQLSGSIVMFASMSATNVNKGVDTCAYNTSKSAVLQLARSLAAEWGNDGEHPPIRVNTISPGYIMTPMTRPTFEEFPELRKIWQEGNMLGRMSTVDEHQSSVVFLLSDGSSYMTATDLRADAGHCSW
ncbi:hypothetical protein AC579_8409 [Pseudocercospora musae]|uniref:Uncharacterized protein n=1 Tax=Pseudocercospora musae TaxID=113226 RepID=A0A139II92_9PEZI|nr:hypothetical protein AC579_8409 [Pseudocercospora musae]